MKMSFALALVLLSASCFLPSAFAFLGPSIGQNPGEGGGLFTVDSSKNIGFGTQTPAQTYPFDASSTQSGSTQHGYIFLVASSSNPGIGLRNTSYNSGQAITYLWSVRDFGALQLYREGGALPGKAIFHITPLGKVGVSTFTIDDGVRLQVGDGDIKAPGFQGSGVNLTDIDPTAFIANSAFPSGNFAFPGALAVGTTTVTGLPANGLYVQGNVGIGTTNPIAVLHAAAATYPLTALFERTGLTSENFWTGAQVKATKVGQMNDGFAPVIAFEARDDDAVDNILGQIGFSRNGADNQGDFIVVTSNAGSRLEKMRVRYDGNVGIGTATPGAKLEVEGQVKITGGTPAAGQVLTSDAAGLATWEPVSAGMGGSGTASYVPKFTAATTLGNSVMYETGGNIGIGTTSPDGGLDVENATGPQIRVTNTGASYSYLYQGDSGGALLLNDAAATAYVFLSSYGASYFTGGNLGIGTTGPSSLLSVGGAGASFYKIFSQSTGTDYAVYGTNSGTGYGVAGHSTGSTGVGILGQAAIGGTGVYAYAQGAGYALRAINSSTGYAVYCDATTANKCGGNQNWYNSTSDRRLKENIETIPNALYKVLNLRGVTFDVKKTGQHDMGFIAQEVLPYIPEVVGKDPDTGYYGLSYIPLTAVVVEAIKEQQAQIEELKSVLCDLNPELKLCTEN